MRILRIKMGNLRVVELALLVICYCGCCYRWGKGAVDVGHIATELTGNDAEASEE